MTQARPNKHAPDTVRRSLRLPAKLVRQLDQYARTEGISANAATLRLLTDLLEDNPKADARFTVQVEPNGRMGQYVARFCGHYAGSAPTEREAWTLARLSNEIMQMAFEEGQPADDASGYCFELEEFDLFIERLMSEVDRLNAAPVQQVSVPDWMASSRAFADRLYMAGWRDHADAQHSGAAGMYDELLAAAPAALSHGEQVRDALAELLECPASVVQATVPHAGIEAAPPYQVMLDVSVSLTRWKKARAALEAIAPAAPEADAGIVDMYRHLQKVTPYRFKKIQDASITDGGDVMYFHKDRFDAALLADMAAHCAAKGVV